MTSTHRHIASRIAVIVGAVMLLAAVPAVWADRTLLDNNRYTAIVAPLIDDTAVQAGLADRITDTMIGQVPALDRARPLVRARVGDAVARPEFARAWGVGVRASHATALASLTGGDTSLAVNHDTLSVELAPLVAAVTPHLPSWVPGRDRIADLPGMDTSFILVDSPILGTIARSARFLDTWAVWLLVASILVLLGGVLLSPTRRRALMWAAVGSAVAMAVILVTLAFVRSAYLDSGPDLPPGIATLLFDALTASLTRAAWIVLAMAVVAAILAMFVRPRRARVTGHG